MHCITVSQGMEPESLEVATVGNKTYIFVGTERMGTISIYSIAQGQLLTHPPKFEGIHRSGGLFQPWQQLYKDRNVGDVDPENIV